MRRERRFVTSRAGGLILFLILLTSPAAGQEWKELKSEHFLVYHAGDDKFAGDVSAQAEKYYNKIDSDIGYSRYDNFWQWENRARIYIYRDHAEFVKATGAQEWSSGFADYKKREIVSHAQNLKFLETLLPHELTHLIFRDFIGFKGQAPSWLDEGIAQWEEGSRLKPAAALLKKYIAEKETISLLLLTWMDIAGEHDADITLKFYTEAVTLVGFMIEKYGGSKFTLFCRQLRDGGSLNDALKFTYPDSIRNTDELEKEWMKYYERG